MARWTPSSDKPVGQNEHIGRRLFGRQKLKGANDQAQLTANFELYHFEENRDPGDVSLDRLGQSSVDQRVRRYLEPRALSAAAALVPPKPFIGWAVVRARDLQEPSKGPALKVVPSPLPVIGGDEFSENLYHAHASRPISYGSYEMAVHLKMIFEKKYHVEPYAAATSNSAAVGNGDSLPRPSRIWRWARNLYDRYMPKT
jgi:hypothetical protein